GITGLSEIDLGARLLIASAGATSMTIGLGNGLWEAGVRTAAVGAGKRRRASSRGRRARATACRSYQVWLGMTTPVVVLSRAGGLMALRLRHRDAACRQPAANRCRPGQPWPAVLAIPKPFIVRPACRRRLR